MNNEAIKREAQTYREYMNRYSCTAVDSIRDREWPLTAEEIAAILIELTGSAEPADVKACRPDTPNSYAFREYQRELAELSELPLAELQEQAELLGWDD